MKTGCVYSRKSVLASVFVLFMFLCLTAKAASLDCVKSYTDEEAKKVSIYVKGLSSADSVESAMCGQDEARVELSETLAEHSSLVKTLIMIDNSKSVEGQYKDIITTTVKTLIGTKRDNEQMAIVGYSQPKEDNPKPIDIEAIADYTDDEFALMNQLNSIEYADLETYLTDVLIDYIPKALDEDGFLRIIVLSDGVDNMPEGKSKATLERLLKDEPVLIHTFGCVTTSSNDEKQRQNLHYISEISGGNSYTLNSKEFNDSYLEKVCTEIKKDMEIVRIVLKPKNESMDGGTKAVLIETSDGTVKAKDVEMPLAVKEKEVQKPEVVVQEKDPEKDTVYEDNGDGKHIVKLFISGEEVTDLTKLEEHVDEDKDKKCDKCGAKIQMSKVILAILAACAGLVLLLIIVLIVVIVRIGKNEPQFESYMDDVPLPEPDDYTVLVEGLKQYKLVLEDVVNPARSFHGTIREGSPVVVGRIRGRCDLCIEYEPTVSGAHCEIGVVGDRFYIQDLQSANGTYVNDIRVITNTTLIPGNIIMIGKLRLRVNIY